LASPEGNSAAPTFPEWKPKHNPWAIALTVTMATFMEVLDTSIANVSLPHIAGNLSASQDEATWVLTSYLVSNAVVLPLSGWMSTKIGRKRYYMLCVALFTVSSFLCGLAPNLGALIFFRVLQGVGGGGLGPSEQSILADTFPAAKRGMAFAVYGMAVVLAPAIGPTLGGFITDHFNWRWVFFINVPVGVLSLFLTNRMVEDPPYFARLRAKAGAIDFAGLALITIGLGSLEVVLDKGQEDNWFQSQLICGFAATAAVALVAFVIWEWFAEHPVVDLHLLAKPNFAAANVMMLVLGMSLFGTTVLLPQYTQLYMGYTAQLAGMALSPGGIVVILLLPMVGFLVSRVDARYLIAFGFACLSLSLLYMTRHMYQGMDFKTATLMRVYQSAGMAFLFVPINTFAFAGLQMEKSNSASGIINLFRNMGGDIGISFVTTYIARRSQAHQTTLVGHASQLNQAWQSRIDGATNALVHGNPGRGSGGMSPFSAGREAIATVYRSVLAQAATLAYLDVLFVLAIFTACMVPLVLMLKRAKPGGRAMAH
jgi:DHA2 family multidrug resistance protein